MRVRPAMGPSYENSGGNARRNARREVAKHLENARALQRGRARTRTQTPVSAAAVLNVLGPT